MQHSPTLNRTEAAQALREIARVAVPFRSSSGALYISIPCGPTSQQVWPLRSHQLQEWLSASFQQQYGQVPSESLLQATIDNLEVQVVFNNLPSQPVGARRLAYQDRVVIDLADSAGECIEITPQGWTLADNLSHRFVRTPCTGSLPAPLRAGPGAFDRLRALLNVTSDIGWARVLTWLTAALGGESSCPILVLQGPSGSCKSTAPRLLKALIDPGLTDSSPLPSSSSAFRKLAAGQHVLIFDDVHRIGPVQASDIARLADDETDPRAIILVRACSSTSPLPEALERRALTIALEQPQTLRTTHDLKQEFQSIHASALGALCTAVSEVMRRVHSIPQQELVRLPDTTMLALAAAPSLGLECTDVLNAIATTSHLSANTPNTIDKPPDRLNTPPVTTSDGSTPTGPLAC
jgi:hypothetical protein